MLANESVSFTDPIEYILYGLSSPSSFEPLTALSDNDWDNIAVTAIALGLAPLLHWHHEQTKVNTPLMAIDKL
jgi:hypothetical protein